MTKTIEGKVKFFDALGREVIPVVTGTSLSLWWRIKYMPMPATCRQARVQCVSCEQYGACGELVFEV